MFEEGGHLYVYPIGNGLCCLNFVCGQKDFGSAVLIRALEPHYGISTMRIRQVPYEPKVKDDNTYLCSGPGMLSEALGITVARHNNKGLFDVQSSIRLYARVKSHVIERGPRAGVKKTIERNHPKLIGTEEATESINRPWRFFDKNCLECVSQP
jgi:DNA-3-methyladenine glycosylase